MSKKESAKHHYFASSAFDWACDLDITEIILKMEKLGHDYKVFLVPLSIDAQYPIENYAPVVEGAVEL